MTPTAGASADVAGPGLRVRGGASAEELAAVLAVVGRGGPSAPARPDPYSRWREQRQRVRYPRRGAPRE